MTQMTAFKQLMLSQATLNDKFMSCFMKEDMSSLPTPESKFDLNSRSPPQTSTKWKLSIQIKLAVTTKSEQEASKQCQLNYHIQ